MAAILVVEDDALTRIAAAENLATAGYDVLSATDASEAMHILEARNDINAVFTDIMMPGSMDGLALAAAVRDRWPAVNIILTSGLKKPSGDLMPSRCAFISKPYEGNDVVRMIRALQDDAASG